MLRVEARGKLCWFDCYWGTQASNLNNVRFSFVEGSSTALCNSSNAVMFSILFRGSNIVVKFSCMYKFFIYLLLLYTLLEPLRWKFTTLVREGTDKITTSRSGLASVRRKIKIGHQTKHQTQDEEDNRPLSLEDPTTKLQLSFWQSYRHLLPELSAFSSCQSYQEQPSSISTTYSQHCES